MARKLASIQIITDIRPIPGADKIECCTILGWNVVSQKGLHKVGDKAVYFEIDSVLPLEHFPELEKVKGRIKTIKLRGQISQGYLIPLSVAQKVIDDVGIGYHLETMEVGSDLTEYLGVEKYEPPAPVCHEAKGLFPTHLIAKTDETRIQSRLEYLEEFYGCSYEITVKKDGTSSTFVYDDEMIVCSRNMSIKEGNNKYWNIAKKYDLPTFLKDNPRYIIQGEICGPGIQKNRLNLKEDELFVFNIFDRETKRILPYMRMREIANRFGLKCVSLVLFGHMFDFTLDELLTSAEGIYSGTNNEREGIVVRTFDKKFENLYGKYNSFKVISNRFLLKG